MIQAIELSKRYPNGLLALDALSMEVEPGVIFCLLGAAGAGKTSAIDLFLGFLEPTAGRALINGIDVHQEPLAARRQVAFLNGRASFYPKLTARQNLEFFARLAGRSERSREDSYMAMREVGLPERVFEERVQGFAPGMRQKLGLAAAILKDAPALVMDEPVGGLDIKEAAELAELLGTLRRRGKAILIATRDIFWAKQLADRVAILQEGRKVLSRSRAELAYENLEQLYLDYMRGSLPSGELG